MHRSKIYEPDQMFGDERGPDNGRRQWVGCRYGCIAMRMVYNHDMRTRDGAMVRKTKG